MNMHSHPVSDTKQKDDYQLRSMSGRTVLSFDTLERAAEEAFKRNLRLFHVVTTEKEITRVPA